MHLVIRKDSCHNWKKLRVILRFRLSSWQVLKTTLVRNLRNRTTFMTGTEILNLVQNSQSSVLRVYLMQVSKMHETFQKFSPNVLKSSHCCLFFACSEVHARSHTLCEERLPSVWDRVGNASARIPAVRGQLLRPSVITVLLLLPKRPEKHPPQDVLRHKEHGLGWPREQVKAANLILAALSLKRGLWPGCAQDPETLSGFQKIVWKGHPAKLCVSSLASLSFFFHLLLLYVYPHEESIGWALVLEGVESWGSGSYVFLLGLPLPSHMTLDELPRVLNLSFVTCRMGIVETNVVELWELNDEVHVRCFAQGNLPWM